MSSQSQLELSSSFAKSTDNYYVFSENPKPTAVTATRQKCVVRSNRVVTIYSIIVCNLSINICDYVVAFVIILI